MIFSHLISWGFPMISVLILCGFGNEIFKDLGTGFCWIRPESYDLRFFLYYIWIGICWLFNMSMLILVTYRILRLKFSNIKLFSNISGRVALYGAVFILCWIIGFVIRVIEIFDLKFRAGFFGSIHLFLINSTSFYIAIVFIYCENILKEYTSCCNIFRSKNVHLNVVRISTNNFFSVEYDEDSWEEKMMLFPRKLSKF